VHGHEGIVSPIVAQCQHLRRSRCQHCEDAPADFRYLCCFRCGLRTFFSVRPIVLSLAFVTIPNSTTFSSNGRSDHSAWPAGGVEQARVISLASFSPSKIRGIDGFARGLL
jgi:hypothetical protein